MKTSVYCWWMHMCSSAGQQMLTEIWVTVNSVQQCRSEQMCWAMPTTANVCNNAGRKKCSQRMRPVMQDIRNVAEGLQQFRSQVQMCDNANVCRNGSQGKWSNANVGDTTNECSPRCNSNVVSLTNLCKGATNAFTTQVTASVCTIANLGECVHQLMQGIANVWQAIVTSDMSSVILPSDRACYAPGESKQSCHFWYPSWLCFGNRM